MEYIKTFESFVHQIVEGRTLTLANDIESYNEVVKALKQKFSLRPNSRKVYNGVVHTVSFKNNNTEYELGFLDDSAGEEDDEFWLMATNPQGEFELTGESLVAEINNLLGEVKFISEKKPELPKLSKEAKDVMQLLEILYSADRTNKFPDFKKELVIAKNKIKSGENISTAKKVFSQIPDELMPKGTKYWDIVITSTGAKLK